jgi:hypothetical protein
MKACCLHQKHLSQLITLVNDKQPFSPDNYQKTTKHNYSPSKIRHSNNIYNKWNSKISQKNYSRRLGISYHTSYRANAQPQSQQSDRRFMYSKHYNKFKICEQYTEKTKKKQQQRRERIKKRVLETNKPTAVTDEKSQLLALRRKGYLFHSKYQFNKRILHLKYHRDDISPNIKNYQYQIPTPKTPKKNLKKNYYSNLSSSPQLPNNAIASTSTTTSTPTIPNPQLITITLSNCNDIDFIPIEKWTPLPPNYTLPEKFLPFVPQQPLFSNSGKSYTPPGSRNWLQRIYKRAKKTKQKNNNKRIAKEKFENETRNKHVNAVQAPPVFAKDGLLKSN